MKNLILFFVFTGLLLTTKAQDTVASGACGENLTWILTSDSTLTISGSGAMDHFNIFNPVPWRSYSGCITKVVMGDSLTSIGNFAFSGFQKITSITIPNLVTTIGESAFHNCYYLTSVIIPNAVTTLSHSAFRNCSRLKSVTFGRSVGLIGDWAFANCISIDTIICKMYGFPVIYPNTFSYVHREVVVSVQCHWSRFYSESDWGKSFYKFIEDCTNINESTQTEKISVYPNPVKDQLRIEMQQAVSNRQQAEIYDIYGRKLSAFCLLPSAAEIDISHLANGMYFLKIGNKMVKIAKQ